jgi:heme-degrading monooxygenase HmoA
MLHVLLDLVTADPVLLGNSVGYMEREVRPAVESQPGSLGMSLLANPELGVAILESFWASGDALRDSEAMTAPSRREAVQRARAKVTVERYQIPVFEQEAFSGAGAGVRLTRMDVQPSAAMDVPLSAVEDAIATFGDTAVPWLADTDGFCSALLFVDWASGHSISQTVWRDPQALAASQNTAAAIGPTPRRRPTL